MYEIKGKVALIAGGLGGIALAIVRAFLKEGAKGIALLDLGLLGRDEQLKQIQDEYPDRTLFIPMDIRNKSQIEDAFKKTVQTFKSLHIVVNTAGIMSEEENWKDAVHINLTGLVDVCYLAVNEYFPKYADGLEGVVVNISSVCGLVPLYIDPIYSATKHAVIGFGRSLADKLSRQEKNVRILTICPGATITPLFEKHADIFSEDLKQCFKTQEASYTGTALASMLPKAQNGSVWIMEVYECYEIEFPNYPTLRKNVV